MFENIFLTKDESEFRKVNGDKITKSGLTYNQESDIENIFFNNKKWLAMDSSEMKVEFDPANESFAKFLLILEDETNWFDYRQTNSVIKYINILIKSFEDVEKDSEMYGDIK